MQELFQGVTLIAATVTTGLIAGFLFGWVWSVMPGLARTDDRTFVSTFQALDKALLSNPLFVLSFVGAPGFTVLALLLSLGEDQRPVLPWAAVALAFNVVTIVITRAVHLPRNAAIQAAGEPDRIGDLAAVRAGFQEGKWATWNTARTVTSTAAFGCLCWALVEYGRI